MDTRTITQLRKQELGGLQGLFEGQERSDLVFTLDLTTLCSAVWTWNSEGNVIAQRLTCQGPSVLEQWFSKFLGELLYKGPGEFSPTTPLSSSHLLSWMLMSTGWKPVLRQRLWKTSSQMSWRYRFLGKFQTLLRCLLLAMCCAHQRHPCLEESHGHVFPLSSQPFPNLLDHNAH